MLDFRPASFIILMCMMKVDQPSTYIFLSNLDL
uniref:Uncharacterized protein n=1 Tax=Rhizophora mucronata TaxID=61149 RepID=A0A2P2QG92_RHIMU